MHNIDNLNLPRPSNWYYENGYLTIDLELFGKYLSAIFSKYLGKTYYFQKFCPSIETTKNRPIWLQGKETRNLAIIGPNQYTDNNSYNKKRVVDVASSKPQYLMPYTTYTKEYPSLFSKSPLKINEEDYLLYFGDFSFDYINVYLGTVENGKFIASNFACPVINIAVSPSGSEINYEPLSYPFISDFIKEIFYYKIVNAKPNLTEADMELILTEFGIVRKDILASLLATFKAIQNEAYTAVLGSITVDEALDKNR